MRYLFCLALLAGLTTALHAIPFQEGSGISGKVTDTRGNALPGATVTIGGTNLGVSADIQGKYTFSSLRDGEYLLKYSFVGYETLEKRVTVKGQVIADAMLEMQSVMTDEVLVSATRAGEHAPLAYSTVDNTLLKKMNTGQDMPFLLSLTPSLVETSEAGNGIGYTSLRIRGTDGSRINVTVDGIPLNDAESQQVFWVDLPDLASSVENIQVQRGAGTSSNGAGSFGATISLQTMSPESKPFASVSSSAGSFNTFRNMVSAGTGLIGGKFGLQLRYSDLKSDGYIKRTWSDDQSTFISGIWRTARSSLKANVILGEEHTGISWWGVPREMLGIDRRYNPAGEYTDQDGNLQYYPNESDNYKQDHFQLIYNQQLGTGFSLQSALHYTKGKGYYEEYREEQALSDYGLPDIVIGDSTISRTDLIRQKWLSNDFYGLVYSLNYRKERIEATLGGGMNLYLGDHFGKIIWMRNAGSTEKDYRWYLNDARKGEFSIYGKLNYNMSELATLFGDLQYRHISYDMKGIDDDLRELDQEHYYGFFNPKAGVFLNLSPKQEAYFSVSVANKEPTRSDFKEANGDPEATPRPETMYDFEMGYRLKGEKGSLALNSYGMFYRDQLVPTGELSNVGYPIMTNVPDSYRMGLEVVAGIKPAGIFSWDVNFTISRNKITDFVEHSVDYGTSENVTRDLGTVDIAYSPSLTGSSDLAVRPLENLSLHLLSKYVGSQYFDNTMSSDRMIDPYFVNALRLDWEPTIKNIRGVNVQFTINNLFNTEYESNAYGGNWYENGVEKTWAYYFPQAGRNFLLRLGLEF